MSKFTHLPDTKMYPVKGIADIITHSQLIGSGAFGSVLLVSADRARQFMRHAMTSPGNRFTETILPIPPAVKYVALKLQDTNDENGHAFYNEMMIHKTLNGLAFIPKLYGTVTVEDGYHAIIMEYIQGTSLHQIISTGKLKCQLKKKLDEQLNRALIQMWKRGVIHVDLHPGNIMVSKQNKVYIIDFNLAQATDFVKRAAAKMDESDDAFLLWKKYLEPYANTLVFKRSFASYHPNAKVLALLRAQKCP